VASEPAPGGRKRKPPPSADALIAAWAAGQHGLVTSAQLTRAGLNSSAISKRVRQRRLHRHYRGVYSVGHAHLHPEGRWLAAILAAGEGAALSHLSAAKLWQIWRRRAPGIDVLAPRGRRTPASVRLRSYRRLDPSDVTVRDRIPVTTVARTMVDLTDVLTPHQLANVIHEAQFRGLYDARATEAAIARANGRRHLTVLERAIALIEQGSAGTRSAAEDRLLAEIQMTGLPEPLVNQRIEVDFHWPEHAVVVELDGPGHARPRTQRDDAARDRALRERGIEVMRLRAG
jgi:hypothetical protein